MPLYVVTDSAALAGALAAAGLFFPLALYVWREDRADRAARRARDTGRLSDVDGGARLPVDD